MKLYMIVTADAHELPLAVCDNVGEVADLIGGLKYDVYKSISRQSVSHKTFNGYRYKIIKIEVDEEE